MNEARSREYLIEVSLGYLVMGLVLDSVGEVTNKQAATCRSRTIWKAKSSREGVMHESEGERYQVVHA